MTPLRTSGVRRLSGLIQQSADPIFLLDRQLRLAFVNRAWEELTGHPADAVLGLECRPPLPEGEPGPEGGLGPFRPPPEALDGQPAGGPALVIHASGERHWRRLEFLPLRNSRGEVVGFLGWALPEDASPCGAESEALRLRAELESLRERLAGRYGFDSLIGRGASHRRLLDQVTAAAASRVPVLVLGEPGTGRRHVARMIQHRGPRPESPLMMLDCAALPAEVLERELFPTTAEPGGVRTSEGATLLLTEITELPRDLQARLVTLLDDGPVRLIATSAVEPDAARREERLLPELFFALTTLTVRLLPLRERIDELPLFAQHFLERANGRGPRRLAGFDPEALRVLAAYDWPGNLRELGRVIDVAHQRSTGEVIRAGDLPAGIRGNLGAAYNPPPMPPPITPLDETLTQLERRLSEQALTRARQNKSRAAELLAISRPRLYRRIKELNIADEPEPPEAMGDGQPAEAES